MRHGKPIKNKKKINPHYFLDEVTNADLPTTSAIAIKANNAADAAIKHSAIDAASVPEANTDIEIEKVKEKFLLPGMDVGEEKFGIGLSQDVGDFQIAASAGADGGGFMGGITGTLRFEERLKRNSGPSRGTLNEKKRKKKKKKTKVSSAAQKRVSKKNRTPNSQ